MMEVLDAADRSDDGGDGADIETPVQASRDDAIRILELLINDLSDRLDHPEIWEAFPQFLRALPD
jgi:hypothetical protein